MKTLREQSRVILESFRRMVDSKPLPVSVVQSLEEAGISSENEIFYEDKQWVYRKRVIEVREIVTNRQCPLDSLGPFEIRPVDITVVLSRSVTMSYTMTKIGDQQLSNNSQPRGIYSPLAPITLEGFARTEANIPEEATHFCWLYPPFRDSISNDIHFNSLPQINVLRIGGFAYFEQTENDDELRLLRVNSLVIDGENGLVFDGPYPWKGQFTEQLWQQNRFQPVTLPNLRQKGARYFAFINPNEAFYDETSGKQWIPSPNGAFAYLYNDDHSTHIYDCYFAVADSCLGVSPSDA